LAVEPHRFGCVCCVSADFEWVGVWGSAQAGGLASDVDRPVWYASVEVVAGDLDAAGHGPCSTHADVLSLVVVSKPALCHFAAAL
jgi:hypothetical protein